MRRPAIARLALMALAADTAGADRPVRAGIICTLTDLITSGDSEFPRSANLI